MKNSKLKIGTGLLLLYFAFCILHGSAQPSPVEPGTGSGIGVAQGTNTVLTTNGNVVTINATSSSGIAVSNAIVAVVIATDYTNTTTDYVFLSASVSVGATTTGQGGLLVDNDANGTYETTNYWSGFTSGTFTNMVSGWLTPGARFIFRQLTPTVGLLGTAQLTYFATNGSSGGSSSGGGLDAATTNWITATATNAAQTMTFGPVWNVVSYGADATGSVSSDQAARTAATNAFNSGGTIYFPSGTFLLTNGLYVAGNSYSFLGGLVSLVGTKRTILSFTGNTNALEFWNTYFAEIKNLSLSGTNTELTASGTTTNTYPTQNTTRQIGFMHHGAGGQFSMSDVYVRNFGIGFYFKDTTGFFAQNIWANRCFVGLATGYKPDGVDIKGRFQYCNYGVFLNMTNGWMPDFNNTTAGSSTNAFTYYNDSGFPRISGVVGYNRVGILVPRSQVKLENIYFEGNETSIQLGMCPTNAYEASYPTVTGPRVELNSFDANGANDVRVYAASTLNARNCRWAGSVIRLMNATADGSTIDSDTSVSVVKSGGSALTVNQDWRYVAGVLLPRSGMSWTNIAGIPSDITNTGTASNSYWATNAVSGGIGYTNNVRVGLGFSAYWTMNESSGARRDSAGLNDLWPVYTNIATGGVFSGTNSEGLSMRVGLGVKNLWDTNFLTCASAPQLSFQSTNSGFSIGGWFGANSSGANKTHMVRKAGEYDLYFTGTANRRRFDFGNASLLINESVATSTNHFVTVKWDGTNLSGQVDNLTIYTTNLSTALGVIVPPTPTSGVVTVAKCDASDAHGFADETYIAPYALSTVERDAIYNSGAGVVQRFPLTQLLDVNVRDLTGRGNGLTFTNAEGTLFFLRVNTTTNGFDFIASP